MARPNELLFDSEASLRLVDRALTDLQVPDAADAGPDTTTAVGRATHQEGALMDLPNMLLRVYTEINGVLQNLRLSRDVLQQTTMETLHRTNDKLREVTTLTEVAATDIQDITTQQLNYASSVLVDMEERLSEIARIFDPDRLGLHGAVADFTEFAEPAFDPGASVVDVEERQALVDAIFTKR